MWGPCMEYLFFGMSLVGSKVTMLTVTQLHGQTSIHVSFVKDSIQLSA